MKVRNFIVYCFPINEIVVSPVTSDNIIFRTIGGLGLKFIDRKRYLVMITTTVLSVFVSIFIIIGISGSSKTNDTVKATAWAVAKYTTKGVDFNSHVGLKRIVIRDKEEDKEEGYNFDDCSFSYCTECEEAGESVLSSLAIAFIFSIPGIVESALRRNKETDHVVHKVFPVLFGAVQLLMFVIAMGAFADNCYERLPTNDNYEYSVGFNVVVVALIFQVIVMCFHIVMPVIKVTPGLLEA